MGGCIMKALTWLYNELINRQIDEWGWYKMNGWMYAVINR